MASKLSSFLSELKRRKVGRVAGAYAAVGVAIAVAIPDLFSALLLPPWAARLVIVLILLGFPVALVLAWALDLTPGGIERTPELTDDNGPGGETRELRTATGGSGLARWIFSGVVLVVLVSAGYLAFFQGDTEPAAQDRIGIAVLPFENLGGEEEAEGFTNGIHHDILTQLSKIHALRVTSRKSVMEYGSMERNIRQIGQELGVQVILEGGVQKAGDRVRINAQLIDATKDEHLWGETYDRPYSVEELFSVQTDLARNIVESLNATLLPEEVRRVAALPTRDTIAYGLFLQARAMEDATTEAEQEVSMELLRRAIRLDPGFAAAYAVLATKHFELVQNFGYAVSRADTVLALAQKALELNPELSEGHFALSLGYHLQRRFEERDAAELRAYQLNPSSSGPMNSLGLDAFDLGACDLAYEWLRRAREVQPRDPGILTNLADAAFCLGMEEEGLEFLDRAAETDPDWMYVLWGQIHARLRSGELEMAGEEAQAWLQWGRGEPLAYLTAGRVAMVSRDPGGARARLEELLLRFPDWAIGLRPVEMRSALAWALQAEGDREGARVLLEEVHRWVDEALAAGNPEPDLFVELAAIHALRSEPDQAFGALDEALAAGGTSEPWWLPLDPRFDSLRSHPRFQDFMARLQAKVDAMRQRIERGEVDLGIED
jgi:TolB-like protein/Flp pilus assembly protein TadD